LFVTGVQEWLLPAVI
jgi:hypothetical protein